MLTRRSIRIIRDPPLIAMSGGLECGRESKADALERRGASPARAVLLAVHMHVAVTYVRADERGRAGSARVRADSPVLSVYTPGQGNPCYGW